MLKRALVMCAVCAATQTFSQPALGAYKLLSFDLQLDG